MAKLKIDLDSVNEPYKLYAVLPSYSPGMEVELILAQTDKEAMEHGVYLAAKDLVDNYGSPTAEVFCIGVAQKVGEANAAGAPKHWEWAKDVPALIERHDEQMRELGVK